MEDLNSLLNSQAFNSANDIDIFVALVNFILCISLAFIVRIFYINHSQSLSGKLHVANSLPMLAAIVFLVIFIVKSSLALSLGLVGALSIVRFRTPIKEPEELIYLFLSIAIGLGFAANQTLLTITIVFFTLVIMYVFLTKKRNKYNFEYNLVLNWAKKDLKFSDIFDLLNESSAEVKLIRIERNDKNSSAVFTILPLSNFSIDSLSNKIKAIDKSAEFSFYESKTNW